MMGTYSPKINHKSICNIGDEINKLKADNAALRKRLARLVRLVKAAEDVANYSAPFEGYLDRDDLKKLKQAIAAAKEAE